MELTAIVFKAGAFGQLEDGGSSQTTKIQATDKVSLTYDQSIRMVRVEQLRRDSSVLSYLVPVEALCQVHPKTHARLRDASGGGKR